jgi:hypothetical protein
MERHHFFCLIKTNIRYEFSGKNIQNAPYYFFKSNCDNFIISNGNLYCSLRLKKQIITPMIMDLFVILC